MTTFKFLPKDTYKAKIKVNVPGDFGKAESCEFVVEFKRLKQQDIEDIIAHERDALRDGLVEFSGPWLRDNIIGWSGLPGETGDVPFSAEALDELLGIPCYRQALRELFLEQVRNPQGTPRKNSPR